MPSRRTILFVCSGLNVAGAERQWSLLIPPLRERGFDVGVLTLVHEGPFFHELVAQGIDARCAWMRRRTDLAGMRRALRQVEPRPDLVVTHSINAHVVGHLIARRAGAPHVTTEHAGPGVPSRAHREGLARLIGPRVDRAIVVSRFQIPRLLRQGYRPERIRLIHNAVPELIASADPASVRASFGVREGEFLAVLVATLRPVKSADVFVRAVQQSNRTEPRLRGLVVGGGPELERLRMLAGDDGVVQVVGQRLDVADIINAADAVCLSSQAEGAPMVLLEAMSLGKPIVAPEVGGIPEAVVNDETGLLFPVGDGHALANALLRLFANPALAQQLGEAGRRRHRSLFAMDRMIAEYAEVFDDVLEAVSLAPASDRAASTS